MHPHVTSRSPSPAVNLPFPSGINEHVHSLREHADTWSATSGMPGMASLAPGDVLRLCDPAEPGECYANVALCSPSATSR